MQYLLALFFLSTGLYASDLENLRAPLPMRSEQLDDHKYLNDSELGLVDALREKELRAERYQRAARRLQILDPAAARRHHAMARSLQVEADRLRNALVELELERFDLPDEFAE